MALVSVIENKSFGQVLEPNSKHVPHPHETFPSVASTTNKSLGRLLKVVGGGVDSKRAGKGAGKEIQMNVSAFSYSGVEQVHSWFTAKPYSNTPWKLQGEARLRD